MSKTKTTDEFIEEINKVTRGEYTVLGLYINNKTQIPIKHNKCNRIFDIKPNTFLCSGCKCPLCYKDNRKKTNEEFTNEVFELVGNEYTFLEPYINNYTPIRVKHNKCNSIYMVKPTHFLHENKRCMVCRSLSYFAKEIKKILDDNHIKYDIEKKFSDFRNSEGIYYKFDFCIYCNDGSFFLLEYDGKQHDEPIYGKKELDLTIKRDRIKNEYCRQNGYKLIRLKYEQNGVLYSDALINLLRTNKLIN